MPRDTAATWAIWERCWKDLATAPSSTVSIAEMGGRSLFGAGLGSAPRHPDAGAALHHGAVIEAGAILIVGPTTAWI